MEFIQEVTNEIAEQVEPELAVEPEQVIKPEQADKPEDRQNCDLAFNYDWDARVARAICLAESGGNPQAVNWGDGHNTCRGSFGLFQIGCFWLDIYSDDWSDPVKNVEMAYQIYQRTGAFNAWGSYTNGSYLKHL